MGLDDVEEIVCRLLLDDDFRVKYAENGLYVDEQKRLTLKDCDMLSGIDIKKLILATKTLPRKRMRHIRFMFPKVSAALSSSFETILKSYMVEVMPSGESQELEDFVTYVRSLCDIGAYPPTLTDLANYDQAVFKMIRGMRAENDPANDNFRMLSPQYTIIGARKGLDMLLQDPTNMTKEDHQSMMAKYVIARKGNRFLIYEFPFEAIQFDSRGRLLKDAISEETGRDLRNIGIVFGS